MWRHLQCSHDSTADKMNGHGDSDLCKRLDDDMRCILSTCISSPITKGKHYAKMIVKHLQKHGCNCIDGFRPMNENDEKEDYDNSDDNNQSDKDDDPSIALDDDIRDVMSQHIESPIIKGLEYAKVLIEHMRKNGYCYMLLNIGIKDDDDDEDADGDTTDEDEDEDGEDDEDKEEDEEEDEDGEDDEDKEEDEEEDEDDETDDSDNNVSKDNTCRPQFKRSTHWQTYTTKKIQ